MWSVSCISPASEEISAETKSKCFMPEKMFDIISYEGNANTNCHEVSPHLTHTRMANILNVDEDVEKVEPSYLAFKNAKWYIWYRKQCGGSSER